MPGFIVFSASVLAISYWHQFNIYQLFNLIRTLGASQYISLTIIGLTFSYIAGHFVATVAEAIFDRIFVEKIFGYPYKVLFSRNEKSDLFSIKKNFYRSMVSIVYLQIIIIILHPVLIKYNPRDIVFYLFVLVVFLLMVKWTENWGKRKNLGYFPIWARSPLKFVRKFYAFTLFVLSMPFHIAEVLIRNFLGLDKPFSNELARQFKEQFQKCTGMPYSKALGPDIYWLTYWHVTDRSPYMRDRLYKFLSLYGLTRNASVALYISAVIISIPSY